MTPFLPLGCSAGLAGSAGRNSPVTCGEMAPLNPPFKSSLSFLLLAIVGCIGGGSNPTWKVLALPSISGWALITWGLGRVGSMGGTSSSLTGEPLLLMGLLNGECFSDKRVFTSSA